MAYRKDGKFAEVGRQIVADGRIAMAALEEPAGPAEPGTTPEAPERRPAACSSRIPSTDSSGRGSATADP